MILKTYQQEAIDSLKYFCKEYSKTGLIEQSFKATRKVFQLANLAYAEYEKLDVPSVCFRIPTGGGKTLLAAHSIPLIIRELLNTDSSLVVWLAPSDAIVSQTVEALKDPTHPYRQFLNQSFKERTVNVMNITEAQSKAFDLSSELPIIIATIQTFSVENEEGRKFYKENGVYQEMFTGSSETPSLFNAIKHSNPIVIMDEAHNAKTDLRVNKLLELNPCFMLELTATPRTVHNEANGEYASNILYSVSASQLKAEDMIKLPIILQTINKWQLAIKEALEQRVELENLAKMEAIESGQYVRPIILFKAEKKGKNKITYDKILEVLLNDYGIQREEIAVHTGEYAELNGINLMSKDCEIRYVITVDKLKEGWDAPFAYILAAIGNMKSSTAVEQLLGRVLRNPYAQKKHYRDLEKAYAVIASEETTEVIEGLTDSLIENGFEEMEAKIYISATPNSNKEVDETLPNLFAINTKKLETFDIEELEEEFKELINHNTDTGEFSIIKPIPEAKKEKFRKAIARAVSTTEDKEAVEELLNEDTNTLTSYTGDILVPVLLAKNKNGTFEFDKTILLQEIKWSDQEVAQNASLTKGEFDIRTTKDLREIDISDKQKIEVRKLEAVKENLFTLNGESLKLSEANIVKLVLNQIDAKKLQTLKIKKLKTFIHLIVQDLLSTRSLTTIELKANLHLLTEAIFDKIKRLEAEVIKKVYQSLFNNPEYFEVNPTNVFKFDPNNYPTNAPLSSTESAEFTKHYYKLIDRMNGEEMAFARYIDKLDEVECWVRNIERYPDHSFWLQTSTDKFYPDFIIKLKTGKILAVEWKGEQYRDGADPKEKEALGKAWADLTPNVGFAMIYSKDNMKDKMAEIL